ncbi:MAG: polyamine ABC transporter substrate-binding protein [Gammaproteobacteria bacterium]|nr:polyamine ABC transporter substrate-binding protein [Gammaproteobacteria bacterium]
MTAFRVSPGSLLAFAALSLIVACGVCRADEEKVLNVYNWSDYITEQALADFTARTGIKVNYDVYDSNEVLDAKLLTGNSGYDVVFPSATPYLARQILAGAYQKLDRSALSNYARIDPKVLAQMQVADPSNEYGVPYMMAGTGVGYNVDKVKAAAPDAPIGSLAMLFDTAVLEKLQGCGVSVLDSPEEVFSAALAYLGLDPNSTEQAHLDKATELLSAARPYYRYIHSSSYINDLANGATCVAMGYAGDLVQARERAREAGNGVVIDIFLPREGAAFNIDVMAIPVDAPHPGNAHAFIDHLLTPEVIGSISSAVGYANAVPASREYMDEAMRKDPAVNPPAEIELYSFKLMDSNFERQRSRAWNRVKTRR